MRSFVILNVLGALLFLPSGSFAAPDEITFEQRVDAQRRIEQVYQVHRIWPVDNRSPRPPLSAILSDERLEQRVRDYLDRSWSLETYWGVSITDSDLRAEIERMRADTRAPGILRELFAALDDDRKLIAETLGRRSLVDRLWSRRTLPGGPESFDTILAEGRERFDRDAVVELGQGGPAAAEEAIATPRDGSCAIDTWRSIAVGPSARHLHSTVWTGAEMIVWGGESPNGYLATGGRYDPATDSWTPTSTTGAPSARKDASAVWTGTEMIVWGGYDGGSTNTGGRYDPASDTWTATSVGPGVPEGRRWHTAIWTGTEMIVWGGDPHVGFSTNTGGRYDPATDTWTPTSTGAGVPVDRLKHSAVWTGSEMIAWGGDNLSGFLQTGGRYDPATDTWTPTSTGANLPSSRSSHAAVWTRREMIVWGGVTYAGLTNTGARYDPDTDTWTPTSTGAGVPVARREFTAVWDGIELIVWGGYNAYVSGLFLDTGGRYDPDSDTWTPTHVGSNTPHRRENHTAVYTGTEMLVWGGQSPITSSGGAYCGNVTPPPPCWRDADGDGYGDPADEQESCALPDGYVYNNLDCDDDPVTGPAFNPDVPELCDGIDNNCLGGVDEPFGVGDACAAGLGACETAGLVVCAPDQSGSECNATPGTPGTETCNDIDDDCNGIVDDGYGSSQVCSAGVGACERFGEIVCAPDGASAECDAVPGTPGIETCNGADDDCNGVVDDGFAVGGACTAGLGACESAGTMVCTQDGTGTECDAVPGIPGSESCNGIDDDCDGTVDNGYDVGESCTVGLGPCERTGELVCIWDGSGTQCNVAPGTPTFELCNGIDDDCDGAVDNGFDPGGACTAGLGACEAAGFMICTQNGNGTECDAVPDAPGVETCNGVDDDCNGIPDDGVPAPTGLPWVVVSRVAAAARLTWTPVGGAAHYDGQIGDLRSLRESQGDFGGAVLECSFSTLPDVQWDHAADPAPDEGYWYLVRAGNCGGPGSFDCLPGGKCTERDDGIADSAEACP